MRINISLLVAKQQNYLISWHQGTLCRQVLSILSGQAYLLYLCTTEFKLMLKYVWTYFFITRLAPWAFSCKFSRSCLLIAARCKVNAFTIICLYANYDKCCPFGFHCSGTALSNCVNLCKLSSAEVQPTSWFNSDSKWIHRGCTTSNLPYNQLDEILVICGYSHETAYLSKKTGRRGKKVAQHCTRVVPIIFLLTGFCREEYGDNRSLRKN